MRVLAGDIGGTKTILALAEVEGVRVEVLSQRVYPSQAHGGLTELARGFLGETGAAVARACFGIAGPVKGDRCAATNLPWVVDARALERDLGLGAARLLNDFQAAAYGIECLGPGDVTVLNEGEEELRGPRAVLGAGTGLGEAVLYWAGGHYEVLPTEGGHTDLAARDDVELGLLQYLLKRHDHVSYERVVSGPGLSTVYEYLRDSGQAPEAPSVREELAREDRGAVIGRHAVAGDDPLCARALEVFLGIYGAEAGNLALKVLATGGVYLAGGIAGKVLPKLQEGRFLEGFKAKGRMRVLVERMPVRVVTNPLLGLLGAAAHCGRMGG